MIRNNPDHLSHLEEAEALWRQAGQPAPLPPGLVEATVGRVMARKPHPRSVPESRGWWTVRRVRGSAAAAGLAIVAAAALFWALDGHGSLALGDVIDQARAAKAVHFSVSSAPDENPDSPRTPMFTAMVVEPDWLLVESKAARFRINFTHNKQLLMNPAAKMAIISDRAIDSDGSRLAASVLDGIRLLDPKNGQSLDDRLLDGKKVKAFVVDMSLQGKRLPAELWVDPETQQIVLVKMRSPAPPPPKQPQATPYLYFTDFDWNPKIDPAELSFQLPKGFVLQRQGPPDEIDAVEMLRQFTELAGGFPPSLDRAAFGAAYARKVARLKADSGPDHKLPPDSSDVMIDLRNQMMLIDRGMQFLADDRAGSDWHYAGPPTKAGEKDQPILWYKPAGKETYRVIDADFSVHDCKPADVPAGPEMETDWQKPVTSRGKFVLVEPGGSAQSQPVPSTLP